MNRSSTRPVGPPPQRRDRWWQRLWRWKWWPALGGFLGLAATLWATLVGQTIPELLRDENAPVENFRAKVNSICLGEHAALSSGSVNHRSLFTRAEDIRDVSAADATLDRVRIRLRDLQTRLTAVDPPPQYRDEYEALLKNWRTFGDDLTQPFVRVRARTTRLYASIQDVAANADLMALVDCKTAAVSWIQTILDSTLPSDVRARPRIDPPTPTE